MAGQAAVPVIVAAREGILDKEAYNSASASPIDAYDEPREDTRAVPAAA